MVARRRSGCRLASAAAQVLDVGADVVARAERPVVGRAVVGGVVDDRRPRPGCCRRSWPSRLPAPPLLCVRAGLAAHRVVAVAAGEVVVPRRADQDVAAAEPLERVRAVAAGDGVPGRAAADVLDVGARRRRERRPARRRPSRRRRRRRRSSPSRPRCCSSSSPGPPSRARRRRRRPRPRRAGRRRRRRRRACRCPLRRRWCRRRRGRSGRWPGGSRPGCRAAAPPVTFSTSVLTLSRAFDRPVVGGAVVGQAVEVDRLGLRAVRVARGVGARVAVDRVGARSAAQRVVAGAAVQDVVAVGAERADRCRRRRSACRPRRRRRASRRSSRRPSPCRSGRRSGR